MKQDHTVLTVFFIAGEVNKVLRTGIKLDYGKECSTISYRQVRQESTGETARAEMADHTMARVHLKFGKL